MVHWIILVATAALLTAMFGVGALVAMAKVVATVLVLLAVVYWAHKPRVVRVRAPMRAVTSQR
jgi:hypothetical protein